MVGAALAGCGDDGAQMSLDAGPPPVDECVNPADTPIVTALYADGGSGMSLDDHVLPCVRDPFTPCYALIFDATATDEELAECISDCVSETPVAGLSDGCLVCFGGGTRCAADLCLIPCVGGDQVLCSACLNENCLPSVWECTGVPPL